MTYLFADVMLVSSEDLKESDRARILDYEPGMHVTSLAKCQQADGKYVDGSFTTSNPLLRPLEDIGVPLPIACPNPLSSLAQCYPPAPSPPVALHSAPYSDSPFQVP